LRELRRWREGPHVPRLSISGTLRSRNWVIAAAQAELRPDCRCPVGTLLLIRTWLVLPVRNLVSRWVLTGFLLSYTHVIRASQAESPAPSGAGLRLGLLMAGGLP